MRPEFSPDTGDTWLEKLLEALGAFFDWLGGLHQAAPLVFWLLLLGTLLLLAALVGFITLKECARVLFAEQHSNLPGDDKAAGITRAFVADVPGGSRPPGCLR